MLDRLVRRGYVTTYRRRSLFATLKTLRIGTVDAPVRGSLLRHAADARARPAVQAGNQLAVFDRGSAVVIAPAGGAGLLGHLIGLARISSCSTPDRVTCCLHSVAEKGNDDLRTCAQQEEINLTRNSTPSRPDPRAGYEMMASAQTAGV